MSVQFGPGVRYRSVGIEQSNTQHRGRTIRRCGMTQGGDYRCNTEGRRLTGERIKLPQSNELAVSIWVERERQIPH